MIATVAEPMLQTELWVSFVSLLRSYVAAANLDLHEHARVIQAESSAAIVDGNTRLEMRFHPDTGKVIWEKRIDTFATAEGGFDLLPGGTIEIEGSVKDLDHVAIELVALATQPGSRGKEIR